MAKDEPSRKKWMASKRAESRYARALRKAAEQIKSIMDTFAQTNVPDMPALEAMLYRYSEFMTPWATAVANRMLAEVNLKDADAWNSHSRQMGYALRREMRYAPTGRVFQELQKENVDLIKSLPTEAAQKAVEYAQESLVTGERYETIRNRILGLGAQTRHRATLIARTEVSKAASNFTQARAEYIGSKQYIWRTAGDSDVRDSHKKMEGKVIDWDSPPEVEPGRRYHAGCFPNCRCYAEPIIPQEFR